MERYRFNGTAPCRALSFHVNEPGISSILYLNAACIPIENGFLVKRGAVEFAVTSDSVATIEKALKALGAGITESAYRDLFLAVEAQAAAELLARLADRNLIYDASGLRPESRADVFYWHFGTTDADVQARFEQKQIVFVGSNALTSEILSLLSRCGVTRVHVIDDPLLRNSVAYPGEVVPVEDTDELLQRPTHCVVVTSDFGGAHLLRRWNEYCVRNRYQFLPVVLQDLVGYVGPLVVPMRTACFECLRARQNSNLADALAARQAEYVAQEIQRVAGIIAPLVSAVASAAVVELIKCYGARTPLREESSLLELHVLDGTSVRRQVLKVPRCPVCSPLTAPGVTSVAAPRPAE